MVDKNRQQKQQFTIIKDDPTDGHGGYGGGSISLENMSSIIVDPNENKAFVDMDAMHARSETERRVKFLPNREDVPEGLLYWIVWVTTERSEHGPVYAGVAASELRIDRKNRIAYKSMGEHVKHMEKSLKGTVIVDHMDGVSKKLLGEFLKEFKPEMWENSAEDLKKSLLTESGL